MKVTMKPLKGNTFDVETDDADKVEDLKKKVATANAEYPADLQKLIYAGRILKDEELVSGIGMKEGQFIVVMLTKAKPPAASPAPAAQPASTPAAPAPDAGAPAAAPAAPDTAGQAAATVVSGSGMEATVNQLCEMGFARPEVERCLAAAFNNPDRAVEYLFGGIPDSVLAAQQAAPAAPAPGAGAGGAPPAAGAPGRGAAFPAMAGGAGAGGGGGGAATELPPALAQLRSNPQFSQLAAMVAQNPQMLATMLPALRESNPDIVQAIEQNPEAFMRMLQEAAGGGGAAPQDPVAAMLAAGGGDGGAAGGAGLPGGLGAMAGNPMMQQMAAALSANPAMLDQLLPQIEQSDPDLAAFVRQNPQAFIAMLQQASAGGAGGMPGGGGGPQVIRLTEEENAAVERLAALGFDKQVAAQAYLACEKNEELAANFLFDQGADGETD